VRPYRLLSARLGIGVWTPADLELAWGLWGNPDVARYMGGPFSPAQVSERLAHEVATYERHGLQYWPLFLLASGEHVGCCGVAPHLAAGPVYQFGFQLRRAHWGRGYVREAGPVIIADAFAALGAGALYAGHHPDNEASRRTLLALGFRYTHDEYYPPTGVMEPCYRLTPAGHDQACSGPARLSRSVARG
jgi:ribosomal-protein-alanine N-acetyltransferase